MDEPRRSSDVSAQPAQSVPINIELISKFKSSCKEIFTAYASNNSVELQQLLENYDKNSVISFEILLNLRFGEDEKSQTLLQQIVIEKKRHELLKIILKNVDNITYYYTLKQSATEASITKSKKPYLTAPLALATNTTTIYWQYYLVLLKKEDHEWRWLDNPSISVAASLLMNMYKTKSKPEYLYCLTILVQYLVETSNLLTFSIENNEAEKFRNIYENLLNLRNQMDLDEKIYNFEKVGEGIKKHLNYFSEFELHKQVLCAYFATAGFSIGNVYFINFYIRTMWTKWEKQKIFISQKELFALLSDEELTALADEMFGEKSNLLPLEKAVFAKFSEQDKKGALYALLCLYDWYNWYQSEKYSALSFLKNLMENYPNAIWLKEWVFGMVESLVQRIGLELQDNSTQEESEIDLTVLPLDFHVTSRLAQEISDANQMLEKILNQYDQTEVNKKVKNTQNYNTAEMPHYNNTTILSVAEKESQKEWDIKYAAFYDTSIDLITIIQADKDYFSKCMHFVTKKLQGDPKYLDMISNYLATIQLVADNPSKKSVEKRASPLSNKNRFSAGIIRRKSKDMSSVEDLEKESIKIKPELIKQFAGIDIQEEKEEGNSEINKKGLRPGGSKILSFFLKDKKDVKSQESVKTKEEEPKAVDNFAQPTELIENKDVPLEIYDDEVKFEEVDKPLDNPPIALKQPEKLPQTKVKKPSSRDSFLAFLNINKKKDKKEEPHEGTTNTH